MSRQSYAVPSCPWGYRFGFQPFSCASVDFQCVLGEFLCIFFFFFPHRKGRLGCSAPEVYRQWNDDLSLMAAPCQECERGALCTRVWGKVPSTARPQMWPESPVCAQVLDNYLYGCGDLESCGLCSESESHAQFKQLEEYVSANSGMSRPFFLCQAEAPIIYMMLPAQIHPFNLLTHLVYVRAHPHALRWWEPRMASTFGEAQQMQAGWI